MSGHSKWSTIKRKKGANDAARGKIFTKLAREIQISAREGGPELESNMRLRIAVENARAENMPKDNIERAIRRGAGLDKDAEVIEEISYEGYGPHGVAMLVECLTDNRNRTISEVRRCFTRAGGSLGEPNSVAWQFTARGYIAINRQDEDSTPIALDPDEIFMAALDAGAEDVLISDEVIEIFTERSVLAQVTQALQGEGFNVNESELLMQPNVPVELDPELGLAVLNLVEALEDLDDVTKVYHNLEITEEMVAQLA
jgi:YebC/PmpR family DNA-binding regulatory protein